MTDTPSPMKNLMTSVRDRIKGAGAAPRLSAPLTDDGGRFAIPKTDKVREQLRDVIKNTMADAETAAALGLAPAAAASSPAAAAALDLDSLVLAQGALDLISATATKIARRSFSEAIAVHAGLDKADRDLLAPAGARLIDKRAPATFTKWAEEIDFAAKVFHVIVEKVRLMRALAAREQPPAAGAVLPFTPAAAQPPGGA